MIVDVGARLLDAADARTELVEASAGLAFGDRVVATLPASAFTRAAILDVFADAGLDVVELTAERDPAVPWVPLPVDGSRVDVELASGTLLGLDADGLEELTASHWHVCARPAEADPPECTVVLPVHGHLELTQRCVAAVLQRVRPGELVVVDDGSEDGTAEWLASLGEGVTVVRSDSRVGFARAANLGVRAARGESVALLHNDCSPDERWLGPLLAALRARPDAAAVGPLLLYDDGRVQSAGMALGPDLVPYPLYRHHRPESAPVHSRRRVATLPSPGLVVQRRWFVRVGGFDPGFYLDLEDADLCLRLRARGQQTVYCPESVLTHAEGGTEGPRTFLSNALYLHAKWEGRLAPDDEAVAASDGSDALRLRARGWHLPRRGRFGDPRQATCPASLWSTRVFDESGYANEARNFVEALDDAGAPVYVNPLVWPREASPMPQAQHDRLLALSTAELPPSFVHVCHLVVYFFQRHPQALLNVGRSMFETHLLPPDRVELCNDMDEIWVPSEFNMENFEESGIPARKLFKVPATLDTDLYDPAVEPWPLPDAHGFVFLSVFLWSHRKGWDLLVQAYLDEFGPADDVTLVLGVTPRWSSTVESAYEQLADFLRDRGPDDGRRPRIVFQPLGLGPDQMPRLYASADAFVLPSRGEGWGRPYMEAMTMGLPTIGTGWSGNREFMTPDNSYLVDYEMRPMPTDDYQDPDLFQGLLWSEPSVDHLRSLMRAVYEDRDEGRARGARARNDILEKFSRPVVAELVMARLREIAG